MDNGHGSSANGLRKKHISVVTPCFNEEGNVRALYEAVKQVFAGLANRYTYEHIFIDNASQDGTVAILKEIAHADRNVKIIVNTRNFGHIRSPYHALLQAQGDAVLSIVADLQDPPAMIPEFLAKWEEGYKVVLGVKTGAEESALMYFLRTAYYKLVARLSDVELTQHVTGFGLYDQRVIQVLREINDPYPYLRGLISDIGFESFKNPVLPTEPEARDHQEQLPHAVRPGDAGHHEPLQSPAAHGDHGGLRHVGREPADGGGLPRGQADLLGLAQRRRRPNSY